ncbi:hypothetical protein ADL26_11175 [Thermoactinomyces vulgaris]|nr:hypothetical protein ADL26_11175 [Thermoactinomyces vulgaris]
MSGLRPGGDGRNHEDHDDDGGGRGVALGSVFGMWRSLLLVGRRGSRLVVFGLELGGAHPCVGAHHGGDRGEGDRARGLQDGVQEAVGLGDAEEADDDDDRNGQADQEPHGAVETDLGERGRLALVVLALVELLVGARGARGRDGHDAAGLGLEGAAEVDQLLVLCRDTGGLFFRGAFPAEVGAHDVSVLVSGSGPGDGLEVQRRRVLAGFGKGCFGVGGVDGETGGVQHGEDRLRATDAEVGSGQHGKAGDGVGDRERDVVGAARLGVDGLDDLPEVGLAEHVVGGAGGAGGTEDLQDAVPAPARPACGGGEGGRDGVGAETVVHVRLDGGVEKEAALFLEGAG